MKKITFIILLAIIASCSKPEYPKVSIETQFLSNGDLVIKGSIKNAKSGSSTSNRIGYSYTTSINDFTNEVQVFFSNTNSFIDTIASQYLPSNTYYFKVVGANDYGRGESEIVTVSNSDNPISSPCGLTNNMYITDWHNGYIDTTSFYSSGSFWSSTSTTKKYICQLINGDVLEFTFKVVPGSGTYTINGNLLANNNSVVISNSNFQNYAISGNLIVTQLSDTKFKIDFCDVKWYYGSYYYTSLSLDFDY